MEAMKKGRFGLFLCSLCRFFFSVSQQGFHLRPLFIQHAAARVAVIQQSAALQRPEQRGPQRFPQGRIAHIDVRVR